MTHRSAGLLAVFLAFYAATADNTDAVQTAMYRSPPAEDSKPEDSKPEDEKGADSVADADAGSEDAKAADAPQPEGDKSESDPTEEKGPDAEQAEAEKDEGEAENSEGPQEEKMSCSDKNYGYVAHGNGAAIKGWLKSCPVNKPHVVFDAICTTGECTVNPDRYICCRDVKCTCSNGVATKSKTDGGTGPTLCEKEGEEDCSSCDVGYFMTGVAGAGAQTCLSNTCTCPNGKATVFDGEGATLCNNNADVDCSDCDAGYTLDVPATPDSLSTCKANKCTCANGFKTFAGGIGPTVCEEDGTEDCYKCHDGYSLSGTAGGGQQLCEPDKCFQGNLPNGHPSDCGGKTNGQSCTVSCPEGQTGNGATFTCTADGEFTGTAPECKPTTCEGTDAADLIGKHTVTDCTEIAAGKSCTFTCAEGFDGESQTYKCTADGWKKDGATAMDCKPKTCDASAAPANGGAGDCTKDLESGATCAPDCTTGFTRKGTTSCNAGTLTSATCEPDTCAITAPQNGEVGDCSATLASGLSCTPTCVKGYTLKGVNSCTAGALTEATCEANLQCTLIYEKQCSDETGYWTADESHLDYPGCEFFCNKMNTESGGKITGCELGMVDSKVRTTKGARCFAHTKTCSISTATENAAAVCTKYGGSQPAPKAQTTTTTTQRKTTTTTKKATTTTTEEATNPAMEASFDR